MFQQGSDRELSHDLKLAAILSFAAGSVNSASFFAFDVLTTNVTGHVAVMANELVSYRWHAAYVKFLWMFLFFLGALVSTVMVEIIGSRKPRFAHTLPLIIEMTILSFVWYYGAQHYDYSEELIQLLAGSLLFAMGLQNAMVTIVSGAAIRTTHLTGLFTDVGIGIGKLIVKSKTEKRSKTTRRLTLHLIIVTFFFLGAIVGAYLYAYYLFKAFAAPLLLLLVALVYDLTYSRSDIEERKIHHSVGKKTETKPLENSSELSKAVN